MSLADLVEGRSAISDRATIDAIDQLRLVCGLTLTADDSHQHPDEQA